MLNSINRLVYVEFFQDMMTAIPREKQLKAWRRDWKIALIERENPTWRDLGPDFGLEAVAKQRSWRVDPETSSG